jgi:iron complex transport system substrate-binding protein
MTSETGTESPPRADEPPAVSEQPRVVSLLPTATEICYVLGVEPVGVSHECDYPPAATDRPAVNRSRIDPDDDSAGINQQVEDAVEEHGGVYEIDDETLSAVEPDLIITQGVCEVCAVDQVLVRDAVDRLALGADVLTIDPHSVTDVLAAIERVGAAIGREERASEVMAELRDRIGRVEQRADTVPERPRVAILDWPNPVMVAGHWIPGLVERAGGRYGLAQTGDRSTVTDWETILEYDPEVLIVAPCGFDLEQAQQEFEALREREGWAALTAVRNGAVWAMDGHQYVNRPGPRLVDTLEQLAAIIHPSEFGPPDPDIAQAVARAVEQQ